MSWTDVSAAPNRAIEAAVGSMEAQMATQPRTRPGSAAGKPRTAAKPRTIAQFRAFERRQPRYTDHETLLYMMHELSRLISVHFDRVMGQHQLTHSQWWALMHVFEHEGSTQSELAEIMQLGRASAGSVIERLEAKGWVERRADPADNRVRRVFLLDGAVPIFQLMNEEGQKIFKTWMAGIAPATEAALLAGLSRIKSNAEAGP
jgi:DNA-binding MarR family transcriptional regulator